MINNSCNKSSKANGGHLRLGNRAERDERGVEDTQVVLARHRVEGGLGVHDVQRECAPRHAVGHERVERARDSRRREGEARQAVIVAAAHVLEANAQVGEHRQVALVRRPEALAAHAAHTGIGIGIGSSVAL